MNFTYNKNFKERVFTLQNFDIKKVVENIFLDADYVAYIQENKFIGAIDKNSIINLDDSQKLINKNYKCLTFDSLDNENLYNYALMNNSFVFPVIKNSKVVEEYVILDRPTNIFSMDKDRWAVLYQENAKIADFLLYKKYKNIFISGSYAEVLEAYLTRYDITCLVIDKSYKSFIEAIKKDGIIIDTDDELCLLKTKILNISKSLNGAKGEYITIYDLTNNAEMLYFKKYLKEKNIEATFFVFPNVDKFKNLTIEEQFRIKFDRHYRFYYDNLDNKNIQKLVKKVFKEMYSPEFIESRKELSGLEFNKGICHLKDCANPYCRAYNGMRFTTDKTSYYKNCIGLFGACTVYGATVDDYNTIASNLQRLINKNYKDYEVNNFGARNLSLYESIRIATNLSFNDNDKMCFVVTEPEYKKLIEFNFETIYFLQEMFEKANLHDFFLDEPMHGNQICMKKCAEYIYKTIEKNLKSKNRANTTKVQNRNLFNENKSAIQEAINKYIEYLQQYKVDKEYCSLVLMHANPFTMGHYKLVEYASQHSDHVFVMLALESGMFKPDDVVKMATVACQDFDNVTVIRDRTDIIPRELFLPGYFERDDTPDGSGNTMGFIDFIGLVIKPALNIKERFLGSEPVDVFTQKMNLESAQNLPKYGIKSTEIPRFTNPQGIPYSAKIVRNALKRKDWQTIKQMVPPITEEILHNYEELI